MFWKKKDKVEQVVVKSEAELDVVAPSEEGKKQSKVLDPELVVFAKTNMVKVFAENKKIDHIIDDATLEMYMKLFWENIFSGLKYAIQEGQDHIKFSKSNLAPYKVGIQNYSLDCEKQLFNKAFPMIIERLDAAGIPYKIVQLYGNKPEDQSFSFKVSSLAKYCDAEKHSLLV